MITLECTEQKATGVGGISRYTSEKARRPRFMADEGGGAGQSPQPLRWSHTRVATSAAATEVLDAWPHTHAAGAAASPTTIPRAPRSRCWLCDGG